MKKIATLILCFILGFFGVSLLIDNDPESIKIKSIVTFFAVLISTVLLIIDTHKRGE